MLNYIVNLADVCNCLCKNVVKHVEIILSIFVIIYKYYFPEVLSETTTHTNLNLIFRHFSCFHGKDFHTLFSQLINNESDVID